VVLLPRRETEEPYNDERPKKEKQIGALPPVELALKFPPPQRNVAQGLRQEHAPGQEPRQQEAPEQHERYGVIPWRHALVQEAHHVFIDEVEPQKSAHLALRRISQRRQNVPRRGDREKHQRARNQTQLQQVPQIPREQQIKPDRARRKHQADQAFCEHIQGACRGESPANQTRGPFFFERPQKKVVPERKPQRDEYLR